MPLPTKDDLSELLQDGTHFASKRGEHTYIINAITGETHAVFNKNLESLVRHELADGTVVWVEGNNVRIKSADALAYSPVIVDLMCSKISEGMTVKEICQTVGFPAYAVFCRWRRTYPWIDGAIEKARADRAEMMRDMAMKEALDADEETVGEKTLKHNAYKWAAGVDDPAKYSPKAKIDATIHAPTMVLVDTGIDRSEALKDVTPPEEAKLGSSKG